MRRLLPFLLVLLVAAEDARASCAPPNPRGHLKYADAAFDGRFESDRFSADRNERWLTFRVDRVLKGQLGETVEIYQRGVSTIGFGHLQPGERVGLTMNFEDGVWLSDDCRRYDPEELADAVKPIARPPGRGRAAFLVGGGFGDATMALLDRRGTTIAYGFGGGAVASVCPGGRRLVAIGHDKLLVRRTRDLRTIRTIGLAHTRRAHCLRDTIVRATSSGLFRGSRRIWRGRWAGMAFHGRTAYVARGHAILSVDLVSGRERTLAELPLSPEHEELREIAVSPDGRRLAVPAPNWAVREGEPASKVAVVGRSGRVRLGDVPGAHIAVWTGRDRFAVLAAGRSLRDPGGIAPARFFDSALRPRGEVPGWTAWPAVRSGGAVVGVAGHRVERGRPGGASELGRLPGSWVSSLHRLPGVAIRASRRIPKY